MSKNRTTSAQFHEEVSLFIKGYGEKLKIEGKECFHIPYYFREIEENIFEVVEVESPIKNNGWLYGYVRRPHSSESTHKINFGLLTIQHVVRF